MSRHTEALQFVDWQYCRAPTQFHWVPGRPSTVRDRLGGASTTFHSPSTFGKVCSPKFTQRQEHKVAKLDSFLTVAQAADFLGVSANTIRNWGKDGKIDEYRHPINNYRLFKPEDLRRVLTKVTQTQVRLKSKPR